MTEQVHRAPEGESMIASGHQATTACPCSPVVHRVFKNASSGRGGSHQGRKLVRIDVRHNHLPMGAVR